MSGLGGMLGGRLKSAKKGRRAKQQDGAASAADKSGAQGDEGPLSPVSDDAGKQLGADQLQNSVKEPSAAPTARVGVWSNVDRKKAANAKNKENDAEEARRFQASAQHVDDILDAIPVIPDTEETEAGGSKGETEMAAPPSAAATRLDTYRVLDREFVSQQVSWNVGGLDMSPLANAVMLPKSECVQNTRPESWDSLFTAVKSEIDANMHTDSMEVTKAN